MARRCTTASPPHSSKIARSPSRSVNVSTLTSAFLNAAVGQLYGQFDEDQIRRLLKVEDRESDDVALLKRVVDTAKQYFLRTLNDLNRRLKRHWETKAITPRALSVGDYDFQPGDELFLDANIWLLIHGPQNTGNDRMHAYSSAFRRLLEAQCRIYIDVLIVSEFITLTPDCSGISGHPIGRSRLFATVRILGRSLRK